MFYNDAGGTLASRPAPNPVSSPGWANNDPTGGSPPTILDSDWVNAVSAELAGVVTASGQALSKTNVGQLLAALLLTVNPELGTLPPSLSGSAPGGTQTASWTVDELLVKTALGGQPFLIANKTLDFNGATVGLGGMDTGAPPSAADLNFYAAYNPSTGASGVFGTVACNGPVYTGANAPAGFTATRRIGAVVTSGGDVPNFAQAGSIVAVPLTTVLSAGTATAWTSVSLGIIVPAAAKRCSGVVHTVTSSGSNTTSYVAATVTGVGAQLIGLSGSGVGGQTVFNGLVLATPQELFYETEAGESSTAAVSIGGYEL